MADDGFVAVVVGTREEDLIPPDPSIVLDIIRYIIGFGNPPSCADCSVFWGSLVAGRW